MKKKANLRIYLLVLLPFLVIVFLYEILPLIMMILSSFKSETDTNIFFTLENYISAFTKLSYQRAIINSLRITILSTVFGILIGFFGAQAAHNSRGKFRNVFLTILNMTSNFAGVPLAFAYMIILGNSGVITQFAKTYGVEFLSNFDLYTSSGLLLMYVYFQIPLSTLLLIPAFHGIRQEWKEANMLLGGYTFDFWAKVGIPVLLPSIFGTMSVLFANALAAYATAYALLMNNYSLLPVNITGMFTGDMTTRPHLGAALSVVMMLLMLVAIMINNYINRQTTKWKVR
ncbi:MAG: ABC transporter permease [Chloroflexi bacterium HGW-Chloroflexi-3]|nr:MAG: ABC transporter permease [Chloroflexi bacterium HGW-Chloroflexi-3]